MNPLAPFSVSYRREPSESGGMAEIIVKHDVIINNPTMLAEAARQFGTLTDGDESVSFDPWTGKLYGRFNHTPSGDIAGVEVERFSSVTDSLHRHIQMGEGKL